MPSLSVLIGSDQIVDLDTPDRQTLLQAMAAAAGKESGLDAGKILQGVLAREALHSTGFGDGAAIPHVRLPGLRRFFAVLGRSRTGIPYDAVDGKPVHLLVLLVGPESDKDGYLKLMSKTAKFLKAEAARLMESTDLAKSLGDVAQEY
jgi:PTS system nitrogen regulatory IIA component